MNFISKHKTATTVMILYLLGIATLFAYVMWLASNNSADSGESAIILLIPASPWIMLLPHELLNPFTGIGCMLLNGALLAIFCDLTARYVVKYSNRRH